MVKVASHNEVLARIGLSTADVVNNILDVWYSASYAERVDGFRWYRQALSDATDIANEYGTDVDKVAGVISALSPRMPWERNIKVARDLIATGKAGALGKNVALANAILESGNSALTGKKRIAFAANILGDRQAVTVDTWAARIALKLWDTDNIRSRTGMYDAIADAYRIAARQARVYPSTMQAGTWIHVRNNPTIVKGA